MKKRHQHWKPEEIEIIEKVISEFPLDNNTCISKLEEHFKEKRSFSSIYAKYYAIRQQKIYASRQISNKINDVVIENKNLKLLGEEIKKPDVKDFPKIFIGKFISHNSDIVEGTFLLKGDFEYQKIN